MIKSPFSKEFTDTITNIIESGEAPVRAKVKNQVQSNLIQGPTLLQKILRKLVYKWGRNKNIKVVEEFAQGIVDSEMFSEPEINAIVESAFIDTLDMDLKEGEGYKVPGQKIKGGPWGSHAHIRAAIKAGVIPSQKEGDAELMATGYPSDKNLRKSRVSDRRIKKAIEKPGKPAGRIEKAARDSYYRDYDPIGEYYGINK
jgi:hypothetical protein